MKKIMVKETVVAPGMEYMATSYPGDGAYWLVNRNQLVMVDSGSCIKVNVRPSMLVEEVTDVGAGAVGPSESFVLALMDKTAEYIKYAPARLKYAPARQHRGNIISDESFRDAFAKLIEAVGRISNTPVWAQDGDEKAKG